MKSKDIMDVKMPLTANPTIVKNDEATKQRPVAAPQALSATPAPLPAMRLSGGGGQAAPAADEEKPIAAKLPGEFPYKQWIVVAFLGIGLYLLLHKQKK